ncbi:MAG: hypothetical protein KDA17_05080 [Candidatus Saccharibacteria bacterium]|nr:hypothetical protein [Candidatus Saccharibacteria bacterium]
MKLIETSGKSGGLRRNDFVAPLDKQAPQEIEDSLGWGGKTAYSCLIGRRRS